MTVNFHHVSPRSQLGTSSNRDKGPVRALSCPVFKRSRHTVRSELTDGQQAKTLLFTDAADLQPCSPSPGIYRFLFV